jgi:hypothetical protein
MTNQEIITTFREFVGDALDTSVEFSLANQARMEIDLELKPQCSLKLDTSQSTVAGQTHATAKTLHADALVPASTIIYVGETPYTGVPFAHKERYKNRANFWWVDLFNSQFYLSGTQGSAQTITFPYITKGTDIADNSDTVLKYPSGLQIIVPMHMARIWFAIDAGEKGRSWLPEWEAFYQRTKRALISWDQQWKLASIGESTPYGETAINSENAIALE